ncbi:class I SAM-dependent methyltransferase [Paenibacillus piri]|uniref:Class I SAM-dependent methyltransferase n=1 Tax=Paenibacillus piri TaxID=2547395 RepID=A0A4R5KBJ5_9BACL|nr:class I SAM-dependent methyltransferase [Paenibacillus piri]TDF92559.1 class I SAM-dependent methyltransferase [Paenibacillus piri]
MIRFWDNVIKPILIKQNPKQIIEVGIRLNGRTTIKLLEYCKMMDSKLTVIDPAPDFDTSAFEAVFPEELVIRRNNSLQALPDIRSADIVLLDGDHNWYTVYHELLFIEQLAARTGSFPIVIVHDTEWPYGRRDSYYDPQLIPQPFLKPYAKKGIAPDSIELVESGGLNVDQNNALYENGEQNGVLTAIEDFLQESAFELRLYRLDSNNGLGIVCPASGDELAVMEYIVDTSGL